ncbi:zinc-dependent alcohol dehydrogenase [Streptomyces flaveolus]|uniref:zinc-dependent alcohol dehydrogenase n=1 Tax=Streptomyces flaveolus TaxID=67297 RepID=UPI0033F1F57B
MKALQFIGGAAARIEETEPPRIGDDEVLVAARTVGICHSDIDLLEGRYIIPFRYPVIPGHEWAGEVVAVGSSVRDLGVGDRVVGECVIGEDHFGFSISGAAAEFFVARPEWLHRMPDSMTWAQGALVEPFSCGYHAVLRADNVDASDTVAVFGAGPIGLGVVAATVARGARAMVIEPDKDRAALALGLGASVHLDPLADGFLDAVADHTAGRGAEVVIEASGKVAAMATALEVAAFRGRVVNVGIDVGGAAPARLGLLQSKELQVRGIIGSPGIWPQTLRFLERSGLDLTSMVTSTRPLVEGVEAVEAARTDRSQVKIHLVCEAVL